MSVSHPLLKKLKGHIFDIHNESDVTEIRDYHPCLLPLCQTLEDIFREGLKTTIVTAFGLTKRDYWAWIRHLFEEREKFRLPFSLADSIENTSSSEKVYTNTGRGRLFIRTALCKKVLQSLVSCFFEDEVFVFSMYNPDSSVLGNEILAEIFSSLLYEINRMDFKLELKNASFLDDTWCLGVYRKYEFVPCKEIGITYGFVKGRAIVVNVEEGSVAAEEDQVEPGDVLDELYGKSLYRGKRSLISSLAHQYRGLPIYLTVIKGSLPDGCIFTPLKGLLEKLSIRKEIEKKLIIKQRKSEEGSENAEASPIPFESNSSCLHYEVWLLARLLMEKESRAVQVDKAIDTALHLRMEPKKIVIAMDETSMKIIEKETRKLILHKHFTEVSACGRKQAYPTILALIIGNTTCTIADEFQCFVVKTPTLYVAKRILSSVGQGFGRTHWEV